MVVMKLEKAIFLEAQYNFKHKYWKLRFCKFGFCLLIITVAMTVEKTSVVFIQCTTSEFGREGCFSQQLTRANL